MTILITGESAEGSAPSLTLGTVLRAKGTEVIAAHGSETRSTVQWMQAVVRSDALVIVAYYPPASYVAKQWARAAALGRPLIRWWVGSDVVRCLRHAEEAKTWLAFHDLFALHIAVAPHLVEELATLGVASQFVPSMVAPRFWPPRGPSTDAPPARSVLVYLPTNRLEFYGARRTRRAIERHPDLQFVVVGDESHSLSGYPNVRSLGWVSELEDVLDRCGMLLRMTEHDGLPRMVIEALACGRYVAFTGDCPGCWRVTDDDSVDAALARFKEVRTWNTQGVEEVTRLLDPDPADRFLTAVRGAISDFRWSRRHLNAIRRALATP